MIELDRKDFQAKNEHRRLPSVLHAITAIIPVNVTRWISQATNLGTSDRADVVLMAETIMS